MVCLGYQSKCSCVDHGSLAPLLYCTVVILLLIEAAIAERGCPAFPLGRRAVTSASLAMNSTCAAVIEIGGDPHDGIPVLGSTPLLGEPTVSLLLAMLV